MSIKPHMKIEIEQMEIRYLSYHEAGHAIIAMGIGCGNLDYVAIDTKDPDCISGHLMRHSFPYLGDPGMDTFRALGDSVISTAGWLAEARLTGDEVDWDDFTSSAYESDDNDAIKCETSLDSAARFLGTKECTNQMRLEAWELAENAMRDHDTWHRIESLAHELRGAGKVTALWNYDTGPILFPQVRSVVLRWAGRFKRHYPQAQQVYEFCKRFRD